MRATIEVCPIWRANAVIRVIVAGDVCRCGMTSTTLANQTGE